MDTHSTDWQIQLAVMKVRKVAVIPLMMGPIGNENRGWNTFFRKSSKGIIGPNTAELGQRQ